jgi:curved DNA-binding protein CbpA
MTDTPNPQRQALIALAAALDRHDYFEILKVARDAPDTDIKNAYYKLKRTFHPDRFFNIADDELKDALNVIAKRVTEAYTVLTDPAKRAQYTKAISGPDRASHLRYSEQHEEQRAEAQKAAVATTPNGQKFYQQGLAHMQRGRYRDAVQSFQSALIYEPGNAEIERLKAEAESNG